MPSRPLQVLEAYCVHRILLFPTLNNVKSCHFWVKSKAGKSAIVVQAVVKAALLFEHHNPEDPGIRGVMLGENMLILWQASMED